MKNIEIPVYLRFFCLGEAEDYVMEKKNVGQVAFVDLGMAALVLPDDSRIFWLVGCSVVCLLHRKPLLLWADCDRRSETHSRQLKVN